jgi:hypothetical protein
MLQQPWTTVPLSVTVRRKAVETYDKDTRTHTVLTEEPGSSIGTRMKKRQALFTMGACSPRVGGKGGNRKMSGANWLAILAELMSSRFNDRPGLKRRGWRVSDRVGHSISASACTGHCTWEQSKVFAWLFL